MYNMLYMAAVKSRPVLHHCVVIFSGHQGSWSVHVCCLHLSSAHALGAVSGVASFITTDERLQ